MGADNAYGISVAAAPFTQFRPSALYLHSHSGILLKYQARIYTRIPAVYDAEAGAALRLLDRASAISSGVIPCLRLSR